MADQVYGVANHSEKQYCIVLIKGGTTKVVYISKKKPSLTCYQLEFTCEAHCHKIHDKEFGQMMEHACLLKVEHWSRTIEVLMCEFKGEPVPDHWSQTPVVKKESKRTETKVVLKPRVKLKPRKKKKERKGLFDDA